MATKMDPMKNKQLPDIQKRLLNWYDANARCLPWRDDPTPYRVWISEIMLQQTRVDTVKPYFERFIDKLPSVQALAGVEEQQLLKLWEGLGYYHRAKNLKRTAMEIVEKHSGRFPSTSEELKKLPGIGPYSAGAIASIAFGVRTPAVDGNVLRVVARITANHGDLTQKDVKRNIEEGIHNILPTERIGDFNQAFMELGATVCLPNGAPKCEGCPVNTLCAAYAQGIVDQLPMKSKKQPRKIETRTVFVITCSGKAAIRKRPEEGLLPGLWELPNVEGNLSTEQCKEVLQSLGICAVILEPLQKVKHIFTHIEWHMTGYLVDAEGCQAGSAPAWATPPSNTQVLATPPSSTLVWATQLELTQHYALPNAFKAYISMLKGKLQQA